MSPYTLPSPGVRWRAYNIPLKSNEMEFWAFFMEAKASLKVKRGVQPGIQTGEVPSLFPLVVHQGGRLGGTSCGRWGRCTIPCSKCREGSTARGLWWGWEDSAWEKFEGSVIANKE